MLPFKKILCPTDFSQPSQRAVKEACELALQFSSELILLHVVNPVQAYPILSVPMAAYVPPCVERTDVGAQEQLEALAKELIPPEVRTKVLVSQGDAADEIIRLAAKHSVDAIVISTHGLTGWRHLVFGSVAEKVVRLAPCTVITIRASELRVEYHKRTA